SSRLRNMNRAPARPSPGSLLDERLRLHNGVLVGEGVERGNAQAVGTGLDGDEAERSDGQTMMGLEVVQQTALAAVGNDLVMDVKEDFRRQGLHLETDLVS